MPPAMKKTTRQSGARGRSTTPASSRASKSVASRASKSSVSASRSRARTGGGKPSKSALGTAAARSSTVVGRAAQKRDADDTARGGKLKTMRRPAADAAEGLEEPEEEGPVVSEAEEFPSPVDIDDEIEPSPFLDARREYQSNMQALERLSRGCMIEFGVFGPDWEIVGSGFGTVRHGEPLYSDGRVVIMSDVVGDSEHVQNAIDELKYGDERLLKLHLCSSDIKDCPATSPKGERWLHSCIWRRRYTTDLSDRHEAWICRGLTAENEMMSQEPAYLRRKLEIAKAKASAEAAFKADPEKFARRKELLESARKTGKVALTPRKEAGFLDVTDKDKPMTVVEMRKRGLTPPPRAENRMIPLGTRKRPDDASMRKLQEAGSKALLGHPGGNPKYPAGKFPERPSSASAGQPSSSRAPHGSVGVALANRAAQIAAATSVPMSYGAVTSPAPPKSAELDGDVPGSRWENPFGRRRRSRSRRRRRDSPSSDEPEDVLSDKQVFRSAPGRSSSLLSVQEIASSRPGALLQNGLTLMHEIANPTEVLSGGRQILPQTARTYLAQVVQSLKGRTLSPRDRREMETLTIGIDLLTSGKLDHLGDLLMQLFKSLETSHRDGSSLVGMQQELLPNYSDGATSLAEKELASRQTLRAARVSEVMKSHSKSATAE